jgi:hypothetical protein
LDLVVGGKSTALGTSGLPFLFIPDLFHPALAYPDPLGHVRMRQERLVGRFLNYQKFT